MNQARTSQAHLGSMPSSGSAAVAMAARRLISEYAWYWLAAGHLMRLADLQRALSTVPCSLAALMQVPCHPLLLYVEPTGAMASSSLVCASSPCMQTHHRQHVCVLVALHTPLSRFVACVGAVQHMRRS